MEVKKSPKADLQSKRGLFLEIGLIAALLLTIYAFSASQREKNVEVIDMGLAQVETDMVEITRQDQKPPEPVKQVITVVSDILNVVKNDAKITGEVVTVDFDADAVFVPTPKKVDRVEDNDEPFVFAEVMPSFQGGDLMKFRSWVQSKLSYPSVAAENGIQGKVILSFVIEKDGSLTHIEVLQSPDRSLSDEAIRVLNQSPKWSPGKQRSTAVRVKYTLPVDFVLQN